MVKLLALKIGLPLTGLHNTEEPPLVESRVVLHLALLTVRPLDRQLMALVPPLVDLPPMDLEMELQFLWLLLGVPQQLPPLIQFLPRKLLKFRLIMRLENKRWN